MSEKKLYSLLLAWNSDLEEGTHSITVEAVDYKDASTQAREAMFQIATEGYTEEQAQASRDEGIYYEVLDYWEGANIWAATDMLGTLRKMRAFLLAYPPSAFSKREQGAHVVAYAEVSSAIRAGEKVQ